MQYASLVTILVQYFLDKPELSLFPIILFFVTSPETRAIINWQALLDKMSKGDNFGLLGCSAIWQLRKETRCISDAIIAEGKSRRDYSYMLVCSRPGDISKYFRTPADLKEKIVRHMYDVAFNARNLLEWMDASGLTLTEVVLRGYVSQYVNYANPIWEVNTCLSRAKMLVLAAIKSAQNNQVGLTKKSLLLSVNPHCPKGSLYGPKMGFVYILNAESECRRRSIEWNDWVEKNVSVWIK